MTPDIFQYALHNTWVAQMITFSLLVLAVYSWFLIFKNALSLERVKASNASFEEQFLCALDLNYLTSVTSINAINRSPMERIFSSGMNGYHDMLAQGIGDVRILVDAVKAVIKAKVHRERANLILNLSFLSALSWLGPSIGLFGALWECFYNIAPLDIERYSVRMALLEGPLVPVLAGLFMSIPATIAHKCFASDIKFISLTHEAFSEDLTSRLLQLIHFQQIKNDAQDPLIRTESMPNRRVDYPIHSSNLNTKKIIFGFTWSQYFSMVLVNISTILFITTLVIFFAD